MKVLSISILVLLVFTCKQPYSPEQIDVRNFFTNIADSEFIASRFLLVDSIQSNKWVDGFIGSASVAGNNLLSNSEIQFIADQMRSAPVQIWNEGIFDSADIITQRYIDSLSQKDPFLYMPAHFKLSLPYFSKDHNYCVIFYDHYCGNLCAETSIRLYKKDKNKWVHIKNYLSIVS